MLKAMWRAWFGPKVKRGQKWTFENFLEVGNPFRNWENVFSWVWVLDVKKRWVSYRYENTAATGSLRISKFRFCYRLERTATDDAHKHTAHIA